MQGIGGGGVAGGVGDRARDGGGDVYRKGAGAACRDHAVCECDGADQSGMLPAPRCRSSSWTSWSIPLWVTLEGSKTDRLIHGHREFV